MWYFRVFWVRQQRKEKSTRSRALKCENYSDKRVLTSTRHGLMCNVDVTADCAATTPRKGREKSNITLKIRNTEQKEEKNREERKRLKRKHKTRKNTCREREKRKPKQTEYSTDSVGKDEHVEGYAERKKKSGACRQ